MLGALLGPGSNADKEISPNRISISLKHGEPWKLGAGAYGQVSCPSAWALGSELICYNCCHSSLMHKRPLVGRKQWRQLFWLACVSGASFEVHNDLGTLRDVQSLQASSS